MDGVKLNKLSYLALFVGSFIFAGISQAASLRLADSARVPKLMLVSNTFIFDPKTRIWKAVQNGKVVKAGKGSGESGYCKDIGRSCRTPSGTYHIISKGGEDCRSSRYPIGRGGSRMPYCMFFSPNYAIHGSYEVPNHNASHGCIRIQPRDARWLSHNFMKIGTVIVKPY